MKDNKCDVCPGCRRHCPANAARCKYGQAYFRRQAAGEKKRKWERDIERGGLAWRFVMAGKGMKKAMRKGKLGDKTAFAALTPDEARTLGEILSKLERGGIYACGPIVR